MLRAASVLIPSVEKTQQATLAFNIASQQARAGDLAGALATVGFLKRGEDRVWAMASVATVIAGRGDVTNALELIRNSSPGNDSSKAQAYAFVVRRLADKHSFEEALGVVRIIQSLPAYFGKTNLVVGTLMGIQAVQSKSGHAEDASTTLNMALYAVEQEKAHPFTREFADTMPAQMYGEIAGNLAREGNPEAAHMVIERIYELLAEAQNTTSRQIILYTLVGAKASLGELSSAVETANELEPGQWRDSAFLIIAGERTRLGDPLSAVDEAVGIAYDSWRSTSLRGVADALAARGDYVQALSTIDLIQGAGERAYSLSELALEQSEKDSQSARLIVQLAWEAALNAGDETKPYVFGQIAVARANLGDYSGALEVLPRLTDNEKAWVLDNVAAMLVEAGKKTEAIALAEGEDSAYPKAHALLGIARQLVTEERKAAKHDKEPAPVAASF